MSKLSWSPISSAMTGNPTVRMPVSTEFISTMLEAVAMRTEAFVLEISGITILGIIVRAFGPWELLGRLCFSPFSSSGDRWAVE